jgi:hypothetical protein
MATTALVIKENGTEQRLLFMTVPTETGVHVDLFLADENFMPIGTPSLGVNDKFEEDYHKQLRAISSEKGHYVAEYSTNPEWNPGYKPEDYESEPL